MMLQDQTENTNKELKNISLSFWQKIWSLLKYVWPLIFSFIGLIIRQRITKADYFIYRILTSLLIYWGVIWMIFLIFIKKKYWVILSLIFSCIAIMGTSILLMRSESKLWTSYWGWNFLWIEYLMPFMYSWIVLFFLIFLLVIVVLRDKYSISKNVVTAKQLDYDDIANTNTIKHKTPNKGSIFKMIFLTILLILLIGSLFPKLNFVNFLDPFSLMMMLMIASIVLVVILVFKPIISLMFSKNNKLK